MASVAAPREFNPASEYTVVTRWIVLIAIMLGTILEVLDTSIVNVAIPDMMGNLGATIDQIAWVSTGYIVANVIVLPLTGWLSNQFGRRNYLVGSILLFTLASFLCGTSTSLNQLVMYRVLQGAGGAALLSTAQATLFEVFPKNQVPMIQAIFTIGVVAAPTFGPTLGGYITDTFSWPWIFFINIPIGIVAAALAFFFLKDSKFQGAKRSIDFVGISLLAIGLGSLQTILEKGNREDWFESPLIIWLSVASAFALGTFIWWELKIKDPAVNLRILKHRGLTAGVLYAVVLGFGLYGGIFLLPIFLQEVRHYSAMQTGLIMMPGGLVTVFCLPFVGKLSAKVQPRILVGIGTILFAASMFVMHTISNDTGPEEMYLPLLLRGASMALMFLPLSLATLAPLPPADVPAGAGLYNLMRQLGGSAGIATLSTIFDHRVQQHRANLVQHVSAYDAPTQIRLYQLTQGMLSKGASTLAMAKQQAITVLDGIVTREATILGFEDCFLIISIAFILALALLFLFEKPKAGPRPVVSDH